MTPIKTENTKTVTEIVNCLRVWKKTIFLELSLLYQYILSSGLSMICNLGTCKFSSASLGSGNGGLKESSLGGLLNP